MPRKKKIQQEPSLMDSMLNYLEIEQGSEKDERMNKKNLKKFLKQISDSYERQIVDEIVGNLRDRIENMDEDEFDKFDDEIEKNLESRELPPDIFDNPIGDDFNPEIEKFLAWLSAVLYSGDHKIEISTDRNRTNIVLIKLDKNGKK